MAKVQYVYLQRKKSESGQTGTVTYDLPEKGFIPEIIVRAYSTPTASTNPALPLNDAITKIEIVDGATVIKSLTGNQAHALEMIHKKRVRSSTELNDNAVEGFDDFVLVLGKKIGNTFYAPDFSRFSNPQIKITWDYSITTTEFGMSCDADSSPAMKFTVIAKVVREGGKYTHGYLKSSQINTWTSAASTTEQTEIPRGEKLYGLMIEAGYDAKDWTEDVEKIKLDFDNGDWVPLELYEDEIAKFQEDIFGEPFVVSFKADLIDNKELDVHMGYVNHVNMFAQVDGGRVFNWQANHRGIETVGYFDVATPTAISTYEQVYITAEGFMPYQCWYLPMSAILDGDSELIDTTAYSRINLEITSGSAVDTSSTPAVVAEYLITS